MTEERTIVVGVGAEEVHSALEFAAEEAVRAGCGLHLVHALRLLPLGPDVPLVAVADVEKLGREVLELAVERVEGLVGGTVPITRELAHGSPVPVLVDAGREARLVVLEHRHLSRLERIVSRTVTGGVAARLRVPVVAVPSGWRRGSATGVVVAGVDVPERADEVLVAAAAEARARGARLRVVHAWQVPPAYEDLVDADGHGRWVDEARAQIGAALDRLGDEALASGADVVVRTGRPADLLLEQGRDADLLVVGRHDPLVPIGSHVGPVARAVLREATCPVLLAAPRAGRSRADGKHVSGRGGY